MSRGRWALRRTCWACPCWFRRLVLAAGRTGSRLHETHLPRRMIVQPVQLSLLPDQVTAPLPDLIGQFPGQQLEEAIALLAALIAKAAGTAAAEAEAGDE